MVSDASRRSKTLNQKKLDKSLEKSPVKFWRPTSKWNVEAGKEIQSSVYAGTVQVVTTITAVITTKIVGFTQLTHPYFFNPLWVWVVRI